MRRVIIVATSKPVMPRQPLHPGPAVEVGRAKVWLDGGWHEAALYQRSGMLAGQTFAGPAVIMQEDCTTIVPPGFTGHVDEHTNLRIVQEKAA